MKKIGENIKVYRKKADWTQEDLAKLVETNTKYISALERGISIPSPRMIKKLCDTLGVDEITLRFGERNEQDKKSTELLLLEGELSDLSPSQLLELCLYARKMKENSKSKKQ